MDRRDVLRAGVLAALGACTRRTAPPTARPSPTPSLSSLPSPSASPPASPSAAVTAGPVEARFVASGRRDRPAYALTFHGAGDPALADRLLGEAEAAGAVLTVFAVGSWLADHPAMAARITGRGHELANHTWSHPSLGRLGGPAVATEITRCRDTLTRLAGTPGAWFRPSAMTVPTRLVLREAAAAGYRTVVGFDVDPHDYADPGAAAVRRTVASGLRPGSIVSLHLGHPGTVDALPGILRDATARSLRPVTVTSLLA